MFFNKNDALRERKLYQVRLLVAKGPHDMGEPNFDGDLHLGTNDESTMVDPSRTGLRHRNCQRFDRVM